MKNNVYNSMNPLVPLKLPQFDKKVKDQIEASNLSKPLFVFLLE